MNCPHCNNKTKVINSEIRKHYRWQRRECKRGHRSTTYVVYEEVFELIKQVAREGRGLWKMKQKAQEVYELLDMDRQGGKR